MKGTVRVDLTEKGVLESLKGRGEAVREQLAQRPRGGHSLV